MAYFQYLLCFLPTLNTDEHFIFNQGDASAEFLITWSEHAHSTTQGDPCTIDPLSFKNTKAILLKDVLQEPVYATTHSFIHIHTHIHIHTYIRKYTFANITTYIHAKITLRKRILTVYIQILCVV